jgi:hypothetical protein
MYIHRQARYTHIVAMRRINMYIEAETYLELERLADRDGISTAALIRTLVDRGLKAPANADEDPFADWIGASDIEPADIDEVVYEWRSS